MVSCGGTISSLRGRTEEAGATPRLSAAELVAGLPELARVADIEAQTYSVLPSSDLTLDDVLALHRLIQERATRAPGLAGVVVTQGTDVLEETAFALDLLWDGFPLVLTGAMRNASLPGSDGPANLLAAVVTAAGAPARGAGVLLVANDEIHAAAYVRKTHTTDVATFRSPTVGPIGYVAEMRAHLLLMPRRRPPLERIPERVGPSPVALVTMGIGDDARLLGAVLDAGYRGVVIEALGGGHLPRAVAESAELRVLVDRVPVVLSSRVGAGALLESTYTFPGSETDLLARGLISSGDLDGRKARVLLSLLLAAGAEVEHVKEAFGRRTTAGR